MSDFDKCFQFSKVPVKTVSSHLRRHNVRGLRRVRANETTGDDLGVDFVGERDTGAEIAIDVKKRRKATATVALELTSGAKPGWAVDPDKQTDLVLVLFPNGSSELFSARQIRAALSRYGNYWKKCYGVRSNHTGGNYWCTYIEVPTEVLVRACREIANWWRAAA